MIVFGARRECGRLGLRVGKSEMLSGLAMVGANAPRVLVLGSFPSVKSLAAGRYYAHPQNRFWVLMGELCGFDASMDYERRLGEIALRGIGLWDVIASCRRVGSGDASIEAGSVRVNDFAASVAFGNLEVVVFNGKTAKSTFDKYAGDAFAGRDVRLVQVPSTSPANRQFGLNELKRAWGVVKEICPQMDTDEHG